MKYILLILLVSSSVYSSENKSCDDIKHRDKFLIGTLCDSKLDIYALDERFAPTEGDILYKEDFPVYFRITYNDRGKSYLCTRDYCKTPSMAPIYFDRIADKLKLKKDMRFYIKVKSD